MRANCRSAVLALLLASHLAVANEVSYFRNDGGTMAGTAALPDNFDSGATRIWRVPLAPGHSTPCVSGDSIFLTTYHSDTRELATVSIDLATGELRWKQRCPTETIEPFHVTGSPASCTVACNGQQVFTFFGSYGLLSYDLAGNVVWQKPMGPFQDEFGAASSPVLVDDLVVLNEDHDIDNMLVAIDQRSGETIWRTTRDGFTRSYSTPVIWQRGEVKQIIVAGALQLAGYDVRDGTKRWWVNGLSRIVDSTPTIANNEIYLATWSPGGDQTARISMEPFTEALRSFDQNQDQRIEKSELPDGSPVISRFFRIDLDQDQKLDANEWAQHARVFDSAENAAMRVIPGGEGDVTDTHVRWNFRRGLPTVPSSVVYQGVFYMVKSGGIITSVDAETGELLKTGRAPRGRGNYYASLVAGDSKIYLCSEQGVVTVLKAGGKWQVLSSNDFGERIMATPVLVDGKILIRTDEALYCFEKGRE